MRAKRRVPVRLDHPAAVLLRLAVAAEVVEHRVDVPLQRQLLAADDLLHAKVLALLAQPFELRVRVEDQRGPRELAAQAGAARVQADDEEGRAGEAKREVRVLRVVADRRVPRDRVGVVQALELGPQGALEAVLVGVLGSLEHGDEGRKGGVDVVDLAGEGGEVSREAGGGRG